MAWRVKPTWIGSVTATTCMMLGVEQLLDPGPRCRLREADGLRNGGIGRTSVLLQELDDPFGGVVEPHRRLSHAPMVRGHSVFCK